MRTAPVGRAMLPGLAQPNRIVTTPLVRLHSIPKPALLGRGTTSKVQARQSSSTQGVELPSPSGLSPPKADVALSSRFNAELASSLPSSVIPLHLSNGSIGGDTIGTLLSSLCPSLYVSAELSDHGALVLGLNSSQGDVALLDVRIGKFMPSRMLACARCKLWWMTPEWRSSTLALPAETQFLLLDLSNTGGAEGPYALMLPLIDDNFRATLLGGRGAGAKEGDVTLRMESGADDVKRDDWGKALYIAAGWDPYDLIERGVSYAAKLSGGAKPRTQKQLPASLDLFGWCTWDAFYSSVSARGLLEGLTGLQEGGIRPRMLIIDDGWQLTDVDKVARKAPASELADALPLDEEQRKLVEETEGEFYLEEMEVIAATAAKLPGGSSIGSVFPALSDIGAEAARLNSEKAGKASQQMKQRVLETRQRGQELYEKLESQIRHPEEIVKQGQQLYTQLETQLKQQDDIMQQGQQLAEKGGAKATVDPQGVGGVPADGLVGEQQKQQKVVDQKWVQYKQYRYPHEEFGLPLEEGDLPRLRTLLIPQPQHQQQQQPPSSATMEGSEAAVPPVEEKMKDKKGHHRILMRVGHKIAGFFSGLGTSALVILYQALVETAPPGSAPVKFFTKLSNGVMRSVLISFFANASDFSRRLTSVKANGKFSSPDAGPEADSLDKTENLAWVVSSLKQKFGVDFVYCWHGLSAYWGGISVESEEMKVYGANMRFPIPTPGMLEIEPSIAWSPAVLAGLGYSEDPDLLYLDMHKYLSDSGIDGVKVDCQAGLGFAGSVYGGGPAFTANWHRALEQSIRTHFPGNHCINCMCHSTENMYRMSDTSVARVSDDFYPRDPASFHPHVAACTYNSLFMSVLVMPDWDMFHSIHPAAHLHAIARSVSGGAVYVSDKPGQHDFDLLRRMVLPDGTVLRASQPGRPTRDCLFLDVLRDKKSLLKVWNINSYCGVVGVFNLQGSSWDRDRRKFWIHDAKPGPLSTQVRPCDVEPFKDIARGPTEPHFVAYSSNSNSSSSGSSSNNNSSNGNSNIGNNGNNGNSSSNGNSNGNSSGSSCSTMTRLSLSEGITISLNGAAADVVTFVPLSESHGVSFAPLGLSSMFNGGGAVLSCRHSDTAPATFSVRARGAGRFLMFSSHKPSQVRCNGSMLSSSYDEASQALSVELAADESNDLQCELVVEYS